MSASLAIPIAAGLCTLVALCASAAPERPAPSEFTNYRPDLPAEAPARVTDAYPLSDQQNAGKWVPYLPMTDEFQSESLDSMKWWPTNPGWLGRQPAFFSPDNVRVSDGKLHLTMSKQEPPEELRAKGYHTWASAAVKSKGTVLYGYFEICAKPMKSHGSSAFWFYNSDQERWTEIDMFEMGAGAPDHRRKVHMNVHVFFTPEDKEHWCRAGIYEAPFDLAEDYHVYALEWDEKEIKFYVDGLLVRKGPNTHWHQPLTLNFDSETMPDWFGLPKDEDLPSTFSIEYVRAWKHAEGGQ